MKKLFWVCSVCSLVFLQGAVVSDEGKPTLRYYGYYWVESKSYGSHLEAVAEHTNLNFVQDVDGLAKCAAKTMQCILEVRWQFFKTGGENGRKHGNPLRPDYQAQWNILVKKITPYIENVEAFYMIDEPYWNGVNEEDLCTAIKTVKRQFPEKRVMVVFARPALWKDRPIPEGADWIGFDHYTSIDEVKKDLRLVEDKLHPHQRLFLVPQSFLNDSAQTDEALAELNWEYYRLARSERLVIGLLNFGLFVERRGNPPLAPQDIPKTFRVQRKIGRLILSAGRK